MLTTAANGFEYPLPEILYIDTRVYFGRSTLAGCVYERG